MKNYQSYKIKVAIGKYSWGNESPNVDNKGEDSHEDFTPEGIFIETVFLGDEVSASPVCKHHGEVNDHGEHEQMPYEPVSLVFSSIIRTVSHFLLVFAMFNDVF